MGFDLEVIRKHPFTDPAERAAHAARIAEMVKTPEFAGIHSVIGGTPEEAAESFLKTTGMDQRFDPTGQQRAYSHRMNVSTMAFIREVIKMAVPPEYLAAKRVRIMGADKEARVLQKVCVVCDKVKGKLMCCGKCQSRYFCSRECQKTDWKTHKKECTVPAGNDDANTEAYDLITVLSCNDEMVVTSEECRVISKSCRRVANTLTGHEKSALVHFLEFVDTAHKDGHGFKVM